MPFDILACPQCGATLPRQARWRMVNCPNCGSAVTKREDVVLAATFKAAYARSKAVDSTMQEIHSGGRRYRLLAALGHGVHSDVFLADHVGHLSGRAILKVARPETDAGVLVAEAATLRQVKATAALEIGFASQRLPELEAFGMSEGPEARGRAVLVLRHQPGFWGTVADVLALYPEGIDPRHMVWMWRRVLGLLALIHRAGWVHSDLAPEHLLVHPRDHGMFLLGWSSSSQVTNGGSKRAEAYARDLAQVAWSMRAALCGQNAIDRIPSTVPDPLAELLERCSEDREWVTHNDAEGIDRMLKEASLQAFGPPVFLSFDPGARAAGSH